MHPILISHDWSRLGETLVVSDNGKGRAIFAFDWQQRQVESCHRTGSMTATTTSDINRLHGSADAIMALSSATAFASASSSSIRPAAGFEGGLQRIHSSEFIDDALTGTPYESGSKVRREG